MAGKYYATTKIINT